jgi:hypothetical protein
MCSRGGGLWSHLKLRPWLVVGRLAECTLVPHVEGVLLDAHPPHVLAVLRGGEGEGGGLRLLAALDAERALVVDHVGDVHPPSNTKNQCHSLIKYTLI